MSENLKAKYRSFEKDLKYLVAGVALALPLIIWELGFSAGYSRGYDKGAVDGANSSKLEALMPSSQPSKDFYNDELIPEESESRERV